VASLVDNNHTVLVEGVLSHQVQSDVNANAVLGTRQSPERIEGGHGPCGLTNKTKPGQLLLRSNTEQRLDHEKATMKPKKKKIE